MMTIEQTINQLITLREASHDARQKYALNEAVLMMRNCYEWYEKAYMRGYHDAKVKGTEA